MERYKLSYPSRKDDWINLRKIIQQLFLMFYILKKKKNTLPTLQNLINVRQTKYSFDNFKKERRPYLTVKKLSALLRGITLKHDDDDFYCLNCIYSFRTKSKEKKHTAFSVTIKKEVKRIVKKGKESKLNIISYKFIDSVRFMAISLSNLVNNFVEGIDKTICKHEHDKKSEECRIKYKDLRVLY